MSLKNGFTLLELLLALLLLSMLLGVSLPSFQNLVEQSRGDVVLRKLAGAVQLARSTAITRNSYATLCRSRDGVECGGQWQDGVIVFSDRNGDRIINQDDELVRFISFPDSGGSIKWRAFQNRQYLQITSQGFTRYQNGNFTYCAHNKNPEFARQLIINRSARMRYAVDGDGDGIRENSRGEPISCN